MRAIFLFVIHLWLCHQRQIMAWTIAPNRARTTNSGRRIETESRTTTALHAGGFGASSSKSNKDKKKTPAKLKPKSQWDRFLDIKGASRIRVAVKTTSNDDDTDNEWLEVGNIKSVDNAYTAFAVARQRALIAEHAKRLFPLQVSPKDTVTWAYWNEQDETWTIVDKKILDDDSAVPDGLEKMIGFEGRPDPSSGFYCVYNEGRLVNDAEDARPSSKKLK